MERFAHGGYGDEFGVTFYGPPINGFWKDRLAVSDRFFSPLFHAVLHDATDAPRLVADWNHLTGWRTGGSGRIEVSIEDTQDLLNALALLSISHVAVHCEGVTPEECLECAGAIVEFLGTHLARRVPIYIEDD